MRGLPAHAGETIDIACDDGYKVYGASATITCKDDCTWSHVVTCRPRICPFAFVDNAPPIPAGTYGQNYSVPCNPGFKSSASSNIFNQPCSATLQATCDSSGKWALDGSCEPVQCPVFDPHDTSLRCTHSGCADEVRDTTIAHMEPKAPVGYGETVTKTCNAGYEVEGHRTNKATCGAQCQYTMNHGACVPKQCKYFVKQSDMANVSANIAHHLGNITFRCRPGYAFSGRNTVWETCMFKADLTCNMLSLIPVANGTIKRNNNGTITLDHVAGDPRSKISRTNLAAELQTNQNLFNGMIIQVAGADGAEINLRLLTSAPSITTDPAWPKSVMSGAPFKIMSMFSTSGGLTQVDLKCEKVPDSTECGAYLVPVGNYVPEDPFVKTAPDSVKAQGKDIVIECMEGYLPLPTTCKNSSVAAQEPELKNCSLSVNELLSSSMAYNRKCLGCNYESLPLPTPMHCAPITCKENAQEGEVEQAGRGRMLFGHSQRVECKPGYLAGVIKNNQRGISPVDGQRFYTSTCGKKDSDLTNDHEFDKYPGPCARISCGIITPMVDSHVVVEKTQLTEGTWTPSKDIVHGENISFRCNAGFRREDSPGSVVSPCNDVVTATCDGGELRYENNGTLSVKAPTCIRMMCGRDSDVCGNETCKATMGLIPNVTLIESVDSDANATFERGEEQRVVCAVGYRAVSNNVDTSNFLGSRCDAPTNFNRSCGHCYFDEPFTCERIMCDALASNPDPNGVVQQSKTRFGDATKVTCNHGFRAALKAVVTVTAADPLDYDVFCNATCLLDVRARSCQKVACDALSISNAARSKEPLQALHGDEVEYTCNAGYKRKGSMSTLETPCSTSIRATCDDGVYRFSTGPPENRSLAPDAAQCEKIMGCGENPVCGQETCAQHSIADPNGVTNSPVPSESRFPHEDEVTVTCNSGFAPAPLDDMLSNCNQSSFQKYGIKCKHCNWEPHSKMCRPLSCQWSPALEPNGLLVSQIADSKSRVEKNEMVTMKCNYGWRASSAASNVSSKSNQRRFNLTCSAADCGASRAVDGLTSDEGFACRPVACDAVSLKVPNAQSILMGNASVLHGNFVAFKCQPGFKSVFASSCKANDLFYGICDDGDLAFHRNNDSDPVERGPPIMDASSLCIPKTCPRLNRTLHQFTRNASHFYQAVSGPSGQDSWLHDVRCSEGYRSGTDKRLPNGDQSYQLRCKDCVWDPCEDFAGYADSKGRTCAMWAQNPTWCYGSPEDGIIDLPSAYKNSDGIDPGTACCVCSGGNAVPKHKCQAGFCPEVKFQVNDSAKYVGVEGVEVNGAFVTMDQMEALATTNAQTLAHQQLQYGESVAVHCKPGYGIMGNRQGKHGNMMKCAERGLSPATLEGICLPLSCDVFPGVANSRLPEHIKTCENSCKPSPDKTNSTATCIYNRCLAKCYPPSFCTSQGFGPIKSWFDQENKDSCPLHCVGQQIWKYGESAPVTCNAGYFIRGGSCSETDPTVNATARCNSTGGWSSLPQCLKIDDAPSRCNFQDPNAKNGEVNGLSSGDPAIEIQCKLGFVAAVSPSQAIGTRTSRQISYISADLPTKYNASCSHCVVKTSMGSASEIGLKCLPLSCRSEDLVHVIDPNINGSLLHPKQGPVSFGEGVIVTCNTGYRVGGDHPKAPRSYTETCHLGEGNRPNLCFTSACPNSTSSNFACVRVSCGIPPKVPNSHVSPDNTQSSGVYKYGESFTYSCNKGFKVKGESCCSRQWTAKCQDDGKFDVRECVPASCKVDLNPGIIGQQDIPGSEIPYNSGVTYSCQPGYQVLNQSAPFRGICQEDCQISEHLTCVKQECMVPAGCPMHHTSGRNHTWQTGSSVAKASLGQTIPISCPEGYRISGMFFDNQCLNTVHPRCLDNGRFSLLDDLKCTKAQCVHPDQLFFLNGQSNKSLIENAEITMQCPCPCAAGASSASTCWCPRQNGTCSAENSETQSTSTSGVDSDTLSDKPSAACSSSSAPYSCSNRAQTSFSFGDPVYVKCNPGFVISTGTCLRDGTCQDYTTLKCGKGRENGEMCQWQTVPTEGHQRCVPKNICGNYKAWPGSIVTKRCVHVFACT